jgi:hypothetical protein
VVAQNEVVGYFADRRAPRVTVALDRQQQLVLGGGQSRCLRSLFAPTQETAQAGAQFQQLLEVSLLQVHIVSRYRI